MVLASSLVAVSASNAFVLNFDADPSLGGINLTSEAEADALGSTLAVEVLLNGGNVDFKFTNNDDVYDSTINDLYFGQAPDFGNSFAFVGFTDSVGNVAFSEGANPSAPPEMMAFASFTADSDAPVMQKGIGTGESLTVSFSNDGGLSITDIENYFSDGTFEIITHVQSIDGGQGGKSQWYSTNPGGAVPEPSTYAMFGAAFLILGITGYRSRSRKS